MSVEGGDDGAMQPPLTDVLVRDRGSRKVRSRGAIAMEELSGVVTRTLSEEGPNGPNGPVTQYILRQATRQLASGLLGDLTQEWGTDAPRVLSAIVGHEPFVERSLNLSVHHMRRRWPTASDWYADLVSYVLRPQRYAINEASVRKEFPTWLQLPLGELITRFATHQIRMTLDVELFRLANTLYAVWPEYEPIQRSYDNYQTMLRDTWAPVYETLLAVYRLRLRPGVTVSGICWAMDIFVSQASREVSLGYEAGEAGSRAAHGVLVYIAGSVMDENSELLTLHDVRERRSTHS